MSAVPGLVADPPARSSAATLPTGTARIRVLVRRILGLHWSACFEGAPLPEPLPPARFEDPAIVALVHDARFRVLAQPDRFGRFWQREFRYIQLLTAITLRSGWLNGTPQAVSTEALARQSGLSDRMVRITLQHGIATGDLIARDRSRCGGHRFDLAPALVARIEQRDRDFAVILPRAIGRPAPALPAAAWLPLHRLQALMLLTANGPLGTPMLADVHRRAYRALIHDLLVDGPQPLATLVARQAERVGVTPMTMRNTVRRAVQAGWLSRGALVQPTAMARERYGLAYGGLLQRWRLVLDLMGMLQRAPELAAALSLELQALEAG